MLNNDFYFETNIKKEEENITDESYKEIINLFSHYLKKNIFPKKPLIQNYILKIKKEFNKIDQIKKKISNIEREITNIEKQIYDIREKNEELISKIRENLIGE